MRSEPAAGASRRIGRDAGHGRQAARPRRRRPRSTSLDLDKIARDGDHYEAPLKDGRHAVLTLDPELQALAEKLLNESRAPRGAIVAMAPDGTHPRARRAPHRGAQGRAQQGTFDWRLATEVWAPAASVFKLVTASALVAAGVDPDDKVCFHGGIRSVIESNLSDDKRDSRCETLGYGVAHSNNAILGKLAYQKLEPTTLEASRATLGWATCPVAEREGDAAASSRSRSSRISSFAQSGRRVLRLAALGARWRAARGDVRRQRRAAGAAPHRVDRRQPRCAPRRRTACSTEERREGRREDDGRHLRIGQRREDVPQAQASSVAGKTGTLTTDRAVLHGALVVRRVCARGQAADHRVGAARQPRELAPARSRSRPPPDRPCHSACGRLAVRRRSHRRPCSASARIDNAQRIDGRIFRPFLEDCRVELMDSD